MKLTTVFLIIFISFSFAFSNDAGSPILAKGDFVVGGKIALSSVYGADFGTVFSTEYGYKEDLFDIPDFPNSLGIGASLGYSGYSTSTGFGRYTYSNFLLTGSANWHVDLFKHPKIDTYTSLNLGININSYSKPNSAAPGRDSSYGGLVIGFGAGLRYYFQKHWAAVTEIGFGMGVIRIGLDYRL